MRDMINNNPLAQVVVIGVLMLAVAFFVLSSSHGGGGEENAATAGGGEATAATAEGISRVVVTASGEGGAAALVEPAPGALAATAPPLPAKVTEAFDSGRTVVLLFVRKGGIDDRLVTDSVERLNGFAGVSTFVVPADQIARYAEIAQGVDVKRVPALVVVRPKRIGQKTPTAILRYGFQSSESVVQAVVDAGYKGPSVDYHP